MVKNFFKKNITPYEDINAVLEFHTKTIHEIFGGKLVGIYLFGSLTYGGFEMGRSDIDLVVILTSQVDENGLQKLKELYLRLEKEYKKWAKRLECSYIPLDWLKETLPPKSPRPYFGNGIFYSEANYGNEWIINNYLLYKHGTPLVGPGFKTLIKPIAIADVQQANIKDLQKEIVPKLTTDAASLDDSHIQSYVVLNICRILYTDLEGEVSSKNISAARVKKLFPQWKSLIEMSERWQYGDVMKKQNDVKEFIRFAVNVVKDEVEKLSTKNYNHNKR